MALFRLLTLIRRAKRHCDSWCFLATEDQDVGSVLFRCKSFMSRKRKEFVSQRAHLLRRGKRVMQCSKLPGLNVLTPLSGDISKVLKENTLTLTVLLCCAVNWLFQTFFKCELYVCVETNLKCLLVFLPWCRVFPRALAQGQPFPVPLWRLMPAERDLKFETKGRDLVFFPLPLPFTVRPRAIKENCVMPSKRGDDVSFVSQKTSSKHLPPESILLVFQPIGP